MSDRIYLFLVGLYLLLALYLESHIMVYALVVIQLTEGVLGWTLPRLSQKISGTEIEPDLLQLAKTPKFQFSAFRVVRMTLAVVVLTSYVAVHEYNLEMLWFFPWFLGFAVLGAGVSGVCPVYLAIRWLGFK